MGANHPPTIPTHAQPEALSDEEREFIAERPIAPFDHGPYVWDVNGPAEFDDQEQPTITDDLEAVYAAIRFFTARWDVAFFDLTKPEDKCPMEDRLGRLWVLHAIDHLHRSIEKRLRPPERDPAAEADAVLKGIISGLNMAAGFLAQAAERAKAHGDAHGASRAHEHATDIAELASGIETEGDPDDEEGLAL